MQLNKKNKIKYPAITSLHLLDKKFKFYIINTVSQDIRQRLSIRPGKE